MTDTRPTRNLALELVRVTEAAALAAGRLVGRGDKEAADQAAVNAMRVVMNTIEMDGIIVIGEGEKDNAPMLFNGERLGTGSPPLVDIAVDPNDGTTTCAKGLPNSIATVALAPRGTMLDPGPLMYMHKIAVGADAKDVIDITLPVSVNLARIASAKNMHVEDLMVMVLDRERHAGLIEEIRSCGARIRLIPDGDVIGALMTAIPESGVDVLFGIGGTPEGVLAACALKCAGGNLVGKYFTRSEEERKQALALGYDLDQVLTMEKLVASDDVFFAATGVTGGYMLNGVDYIPSGARTDSLVMRGLTGTVRRIQSTHQLTKLARISSIEY